MTMESLILSPHDDDPCESTSLSVALLLSYDASVILTKFFKGSKGSGTFDER